jgi:hypothetical protein
MNINHKVENEVTYSNINQLQQLKIQAEMQ